MAVGVPPGTCFGGGGRGRDAKGIQAGPCLFQGSRSWSLGRSGGEVPEPGERAGRRQEIRGQGEGQENAVHGRGSPRGSGRGPSESGGPRPYSKVPLPAGEREISSFLSAEGRMRREHITARLLRAISGMTQQRFGEEAGIDPSVIADFELGSALPSRDHLERMAAAMGLTG